MLKVIKGGFYTSVQDFGRFGYQEFGVPYSGVMDRLSAAFANSILGNDKVSSVLEITMAGPTLEFTKRTLICISGANLNPKINDHLVKLNKALHIEAGDVLSFSALQEGFRCYLAVLGGFNAEKVMNSQSMYSNITSKVVLSKNDTLDYTEVLNDKIHSHASIKFPKNHFNSKYIEAFKGPEFDLLSEAQKEMISTFEFSISNNNNRMAYQLEEPIKNNLKPIITSLVLPGTVQLTPAGNLIILMRDCQTTGGYPRVLQLTEQAINILSQKYVGNKVQFKLI